MSKPLELKALYYPYARCSNENTLKRAILIFDEIGFVDPTSPSMREGLMTDDEIPQAVIDDWKIVRDAYKVLLERGIIRLYDPDPLVQKHDNLLTGALKADLDDDTIWEICSTPGTPETWSTLRRKVPTSAFNLLQSTVPGYVVMQPKELFRRKSLLRKRGEDPNEHPIIKRLEYHRYLFHDGKIAWELDSGMHKATRKKEPQEIEFSCILPCTTGSSLAVNTALILADNEGLVPFTDSRLHHEMLVAKFQRISSLLASKDVILSGVRRLHPEKLRRLAFTLLDVMVPEELISKMSIADCLKYKDAGIEAFQRLKSFIGELASQIESEPMTDEFEKEIQKLIHQKVLPEAQKAKDKGIDIYEKLFGKLGKKVAAALTPTLGASIFAGLTTPVMLAVASAAALGAILPDLVDALVEERAMHRNVLSYLLELK
jgi:hypothetical protein